MKRSEFEKKLRDIHPNSFQWALNQCHFQTELAEEILQDSYLKALNNLDSFSEKSSFKTWLFTIIKNTAIDHFRKQNRRNELDHVAFQDIKSYKSATQEKRLRSKGNKEAATHLLSQLSKREKEVVELVMYQELSVTEAAEIMGVSRGSVNTYLKRAKENLKDKIEEGKNKSDIPNFEHSYTRNIKKVS